MQDKHHYVGEPPQKQHDHPHHNVSADDGTLWATIFLMLIAVLGKALVSDEPFSVKKLIGELLLSVVGAVALWAYGILQHLTIPEAILYGALGGLGGVRLLEWIIKAIRAIRATSS